MANILTAISEITHHYHTCIKSITDGSNRANNMGDALEVYIKNAFAGVLGETSKNAKIAAISKEFSYTGSKNNPPDMMLRGGDAIEVKKIESARGNLPLNSSHPKEKLLVSNKKINKACRKCEDWQEKDLIYTIGQIKKGTTELSMLWMVYGDCYAADIGTYEKVESSIKDSISCLENVEIKATNELSGAKGIDPLGISELRVRGMWQIQHPSKVFDCIYKPDASVSFELIVLMREEKYLSFPKDDIKRLENQKNISINLVQIKNPNNPANLMNARLINFKKRH